MQALIIIEASGKAQAWGRILDAIRMPSRVIATSGHISRFQDRLFPLGINLTPGKQLDPGRTPDPEKSRMIVEAVAAAPDACPIVIATDNDVEGDVIAYEVVELILAHFPGRSNRLVRVRPGPITKEGVRAALASATRIVARRVISDSIQGRARAVTDRWIGSTFSKLAGVPVGRVRSALLGASLLLNRDPNRLRQRPETGEITFQARASMGGRPFVARIALDGTENPDHLRRLMDLARRHAGLLVPGTVRPRASLSAAVAPRSGTVRPFNTADALAYASRHHGISAPLAMRGLQDAYQEGQISYPRTDSRDLSAASSSRVVMLGFSCGLSGLEPEVLSTEGRISAEGDIRVPDAHEALHPVMSLSTVNSDRLRQLIRKPVREPVNGWSREDIRDLMTIMVARRSFEASREIMLEPGNWRVDNIAGMDPQDAALLSDLDWHREQGFNYPWTRNFGTGVRSWPMESVLLELMAGEGIGRPSTYAGHLRTAAESGEIEPAPFPKPPRPTERGMQSLRRTPRAVWDPETCRLIEFAMENPMNIHKEDESGSVSDRARHRVLSWFVQIPEEMRAPLVAALGIGTAGGAGGVCASKSVKREASGQAPETTDALPEPSPYQN